MRIIHVVTYISDDGAFGGPVRVALGQAEALAARGHEVDVYAAAPIDEPRVVEQGGYTLRTFPARHVLRRLGFASMRAAGLNRALSHALPGTDVAHIHLARDLVTLPAARLVRKAGLPYVVQPHGMIDRSTNPLAEPIDRWETRRALTQAARVLVLTADEESEVGKIAPGVRAEKIANGIKVDGEARGNAHRRLVLYLARLHPRKRPGAFVEVARTLAPDYPDLQFVLAGPDEGEGGEVERAIADADMGGQLRWIGPVDPTQTDNLLGNAVVYVLPSVGEIFPMTLLEAFRAGTPAVVTSSLGISDACRHYGAAIVTDGSVEELTDAVRTVLDSTEKVTELRAGAMRYLREELDVERVADHLEDAYAASRRAS